MKLCDDRYKKRTWRLYPLLAPQLEALLISIGELVYILYRPLTLYMLQPLELMGLLDDVRALRSAHWFPPIETVPEWVPIHHRTVGYLLHHASLVGVDRRDVIVDTVLIGEVEFVVLCPREREYVAKCALCGSTLGTCVSHHDVCLTVSLVEVCQFAAIGRDCESA